jgi:hypothetical protein
MLERFFGDAGMADRTLFPRVFGLKKPAPLWTAPSFDRCLAIWLIWAALQPSHFGAACKKRDGYLGVGSSSLPLSLTLLLGFTISLALTLALLLSVSLSLPPPWLVSLSFCLALPLAPSLLLLLSFTLALSPSWALGLLPALALLSLF